MPKVLHVCYYDILGGAAKAAHRIHCALLHAGVESRMAVMEKLSDDPHVIQPMAKAGEFRARMARTVVRALCQLQRDPNPSSRTFCLFPIGLGAWINRCDADIVNIHWVGKEMLSVGEIAAIRKPIVWTMHDMWPFCATEHYDDLNGAARWQSGYRADRAAAATGIDLDAILFARKKRLWRNKRIHLIAPSRWIAGCAGKSALFSHQPCRVIRNCVDTNVFKPIDRKTARGILNLDPDKKYILFGALSSISDTRKGFHLLKKAFRRLTANPDAERLELLVFGASRDEAPIDLGFPVHCLGNILDEILLALCYSAADIFVAPSMQDNLPNTLVEALACGTPCVAFDVGGMSDLVDHGVTGYLVEAFDTEAFAGSICRVLQAGNPLALSAACRNTALSLFGQDSVAASYLAYYREIFAATICSLKQ